MPIVLGFFGFGAAAHIVTQTALFQKRRIFAFTRPGDTRAQEFARSLGAEWVGDSTSLPPEELDAAIIFAPVGSLVPSALRAVRKGGVVVCGGIHMSDIPGFPYSILWGERVLRSVANLTRRDGEEFLALAPKIPVQTTTQVFPLHEANTALEHLRTGQLTGAAVLVPETHNTISGVQHDQQIEPASMRPGWLNAIHHSGMYPHPVAEIQLLETHISWIILTGDWVYKLKKPVKFDFVDYSTLELRLAACRDELRLNRRTAPELYDDVVALTADEGGPRFGGTGPTLEYAVRMHQFSQSDLLDQLIARNELSIDMIEMLAQEVAALHKNAEIAVDETTFGEPDAIGKRFKSAWMFWNRPSCHLSCTAS